MTLAQQTIFDYAALDSNTRRVVQEEDKQFDHNMKASESSFIQACRNLSNIHQALRYKRPGFDEYCNSKEGLSRTTAYRMLDVARMCPRLGHIQISPWALYLLAAPSTPEEIRQDAIAKAEAGQPITHAAVKEMITAYRDQEDSFNELPFDQPFDTPPPPLAPASSHQLLNQSISNEWYTPPEYIEAARELMGGIDTDPASNEQANAWIKARTYYTQEVNGFNKPWPGRVWMNPPYGKEENDSNQERWTSRLIEQYLDGITTEAVCLVNAVPGNVWFAPLWEFPICFVARRIRFLDPSGQQGSPTHSNALIYLPRKDSRQQQIARFVRIFSRFGPVAARLIEYDNQLFIHGVDAP